MENSLTELESENIEAGQKCKATVLQSSHCDIRLVSWCIVLMEQHPFCQLFRPLGLDFFSQLLQQKYIVCTVYSYGFQKAIHEDYVLCVTKNCCMHLPTEESDTHLFWRGWSGIMPLYWLYFGVWSQVIDLTVTFREITITKAEPVA